MTITIFTFTSSEILGPETYKTVSFIVKVKLLVIK